MKLALSFALALSLLAPTPAGQMILGRGEQPRIRTTNLAVHVDVTDGVATTRLTQTLRNEAGPAQGEAIWLLPLPVGAAADGFTMVAGGVTMESEVLGADAARGVYEEIVRSRRDPGLLEYVGRGCLRARVFPIPRGGDVRVEVTYRHVLAREGELATWSLPVADIGVAGRPPEQVTLDLRVASRKEIKNAFASVAGVDVVRKGRHELRASYEGPGSAFTGHELELFYGLSDSDFGLHLLSHRGTEEDEGTFLMLVAPKRDWDEDVVQPREITFVVDTSGSMARTKLRQAQESLRFFLNSLRANDRFNVVPFSTEARPFFPAPVDATVEHLSEALQKVRTLEAVGGTNIADALRAGLKGSEDRGERVPIVVFLTDGLPTVGQTQPQELLRLVEQHNGQAARIFVLGVGHDVNTVLLDSFAANSKGSRDYVRPEEDIERKAGALLQKLSHPVLTDLALEVDGLAIERLVPSELSDLFAGEQLELVGRYRGAGPRAIRLTGSYRGTRREYVFEGTFAEPGASEHAFLDALWAQRRVGLLLDEIRRNGELAELVEEVKRLGERYELVTPYTSHLIVEDAPQVSLGVPIQNGRPGGGGSGPASNSNAPTSPGVLWSGDAESTGNGFFLGRGAADRRDDDQALVILGQHLADLEILTLDAPAEAYHELAVQLLPELRRGEREVRLLRSDAVSGAEAVQRSEYLKDLYAGRASSGLRSLRSYFTKRVGTKTFELHGGVWQERALELTDAQGAPRPRTEIVAFSDDYFRWIRERPELAPFLTLGERVLFESDGELIEVVAAAPATPDEREDDAAQNDESR